MQDSCVCHRGVANVCEEQHVLKYMKPFLFASPTTNSHNPTVTCVAGEKMSTQYVYGILHVFLYLYIYIYFTRMKHTETRITHIKTYITHIKTYIYIYFTHMKHA